MNPLYQNFAIETKLFQEGFTKICGVDEVGRGAWAGPITACAFVIDPEIFLVCVKDSKKILEQRREEIFDDVCQSALNYSIAAIDNREIDRIGITQANTSAMVKAIKQLQIQPDIILVDGNIKIQLSDNGKKFLTDYKPDKEKSVTCLPVGKVCNSQFVIHNIINGDEQSYAIAVASIVAKVTRDRMMREFDAMNGNNYQFAKHKGYGTKLHQQCLRDFGVSKLHRKSYRPVKRLFKIHTTSLKKS